MYLNELSEKVWMTKNARFCAAKRMCRNRISSTASVSLLSASVIAINMLAFLNIGTREKTIITIVTVILSTFALVMSLLISILRYEYRENNYHQCGLDLEHLNQQLKIKILELSSQGMESSEEDNKKYLEDYDAILRKYNLNHTDFDFQYSKFKAIDIREKSLLKNICYWIKWNFLDVSMLYWLIAFIPIIVIILAFCGILS